MAICWTDFRTLTRCNMSAFNPVLLAAQRTLSYCCRCFPASPKLSTGTTRVNSCGPARKNLLKPYAGVLDCEHLHQHSVSNSVALWTRTMHSSSCLYVLANWVTKCRLLDSCSRTGDLSLQRTLNRLSATSKHLYNSRTVSLSHSSSSKNSQKWSLTRVGQRMVCFVVHLFGFIC